MIQDTPTTDQPWRGALARLVVVQGWIVGKVIDLESGRSSIGRSEESVICIPLPELSRHHAELEQRDVGFILRDLGSRNGTFVNGQRLPKHGQALQVGDTIRLGSDLVLRFTVVDPVEAEIHQRQRLETLGRLTAGIAHDFNNMLGAIAANLAFLESIDGNISTGDRDFSECLADIRGATDRAAELSQRLVAFARGEERTGEGVDVAAVVRVLARMVRRTVGASVQVETEVDDYLPVAAAGLDLHQVLMNLCLNARDAMPNGGTIRIAAHAHRTADRAVVRITVSDSGHGMSPVLQGRIFEPFFSTKGKGGFGVGLSTCREIVLGLGGAIDVESREGHGSSFHIELPTTESRRQITRSSTLMPPEEVELPKLRILVVDDEVFVRRSCRRILTQHGHEVIEAAGGREAVRLYASGQPPDVVLLDLDMPQLDGIGTLKLLRDLDPDVRVVMMSGHEEAPEAKLRSIGARSLLRKPWQTHELLIAVADAYDQDDTGNRLTSF